MIPRKNLAPKSAAAVVLNAWLDTAQEAHDENAKRAERLQSPKPIPKIDVGQLLEQTRKLTEEYFSERQQQEGPQWIADLNAWLFEAEQALKRDLFSLARKTNDEDLWRQLHETWPERKPPRDLAPEELKQLVELQAEADELIQNLENTVVNAIEELWRLLQAEAGIVQGTSGSRLLLRQAGEFVNYLSRLIDIAWGHKTGKTVTTPESFKRDAERYVFQTRKWGK